MYDMYIANPQTRSVWAHTHHTHTRGAQERHVVLWIPNVHCESTGQYVLCLWVWAHGEHVSIERIRRVGAQERHVVVSICTLRTFL